MAEGFELDFRLWGGRMNTTNFGAHSVGGVGDDGSTDYRADFLGRVLDLAG